MFSVYIRLPCPVILCYFSGMRIQGPPLEIGIPGTAPIPFATIPAPYTPGQAAVFQISFDLYVTQTSGSWRNIFEHGAYNYASGNRAPSVFLTGSDGAPANRIYFCLNQYSAGGASITSVAIPMNTWYNIVITSDGSNARVYMNGVRDAAADFQGTFTWPAVDDPWNFCNSYFNPAGSLKIRNMYYWPVVIAGTFLYYIVNGKV